MAVTYHDKTKSYVNTNSVAYLAWVSNKKNKLEDADARYDKELAETAKEEKKRTGNPAEAILRCRELMFKNFWDTNNHLSGTPVDIEEMLDFGWVIYSKLYGVDPNADRSERLRVYLTELFKTNS